MTLLVEQRASLLENINDFNKLRVKKSGFTLLEVMVSLAILSVSLMVLLDAQLDSVVRTWEARRLSQAIGLARMKMFEVEHQLRKDGFEAHEFDEEECADFSDDGLEGVEDFSYCVTTETVEFPDITLMQQNIMGMLQTMSMGGDSPLSGGPLGDLISQFLPEGLGEEGEDAAQSFMSQVEQTLMPQIAAGISMLEGLLQASVRKVTVTVRWTVKGRERSYTLISYFTDPKALDRGFTFPSIPAGALGGGGQ